MKIMHHVGINIAEAPKIFREILILGIEHKVLPLPGREYGMAFFEIDETDNHWKNIQKFIKRSNLIDITYTVFSDEEIAAAQWSRLIPTHECFYPQPEVNMRWKERTLENICPCCGTGYRQKAPYYLRIDPKVPGVDFFSLFWTYTFFCKKHVIGKLRHNGITGFETLDPLVGKGKVPSETVTQLVFPNLTDTALADIDKVFPETCRICGREKFLRHDRGMLRIKEVNLQANSDFLVVGDWFGSDSRTGWREVLVSSRLARLILENKWRGIKLSPVALV